MGENEEFSENQESQQTEEQQQQVPERPTVIEIKTPLDKPEFDFFMDRYMKRMGLTDRKEAAISLANMFTDLGLDPYADLKELQSKMKEMNSILKTLPDSPQANQVKDTLAAVYASKAGKAVLEQMPKMNGTDPYQDRLERLMDRYMPMILAGNMMGRMMNPDMQWQQPNNMQQQHKSEIPEEFKAEMAAIKAQLGQTQELLRQQSEERNRKEFAEGIVSTIHQSFGPQIDELRNQVEVLTSSLAARQQEQVQPQQTTQEMLGIQRDIADLRNLLSQKTEAKNLSLNDLEVVMGTLEQLEKRVKKDVPAGEFDWKTATMSTLGEVGKEAISAFREIQSAKQPPGAYGPMQQNQGPVANTKEINVQKLQHYIMQNLSKGIRELRMTEAKQALGLTDQEIFEAYNALKAAGWIADNSQQGAQQQQTQAAQLGQQQTLNGNLQESMQQSQEQQPTGGKVPDKFDPNQPFLER